MGEAHVDGAAVEVKREGVSGCEHVRCEQTVELPTNPGMCAGVLWASSRGGTPPAASEPSRRRIAEGMGRGPPWGSSSGPSAGPGAGISSGPFAGPGAASSSGPSAGPGAASSSGPSSGVPSSICSAASYSASEPGLSSVAQVAFSLNSCHLSQKTLNLWYSSVTHPGASTRHVKYRGDA